MATLEEIENAWVKFTKAAILADFPNHSVILSEQDGSRPAKPYITIKITGPNRVMETDPKVFDETSQTFKFVGRRRYNVSFQSYGLNHTDVLDDIIIGSQNLEFNTTLKQCDIGIEIRGNITDISSTVSTAWEKRGSLDISFLASKIKLTNIGPIESAEIDGKAIKPDATEIIIDKFTVPEP